MDVETFTEVVIEPGLALLPPKMWGKDASTTLLAIAIQESDLRFRFQVRGPARGWWQFEEGGGVRGVLMHRATRDYARDACRALHIGSTSAEVYEAIPYCDALATAFARLLLWTLPQALSTTENEAWDQYIAAWRPGKPHRDRWAEVSWPRAVAFYG